MTRLIFGILMLMAAASFANAATISYRLHDVEFNDGSTAAGNFLFDTVSGTTSSLTLTTSPNGLFPGYEYTDDSVYDTTFNSLVMSSTGDFLGINGMPGDSGLSLVFAGSLSAGGTIAIASGTEIACMPVPSQDCTSIIGRNLSGGWVVQVIPVPAAWLLFVSGLLSLATARMQRSVPSKA